MFVQCPDLKYIVIGAIAAADPRYLLVRQTEHAAYWLCRAVSASATSMFAQVDCTRLTDNGYHKVLHRHVDYDFLPMVYVDTYVIILLVHVTSVKGRGYAATCATPHGGYRRLLRGGADTCRQAPTYLTMAAAEVAGCPRPTVR
ncbi:hypothetical protein EVAR_94017_1 [Eumeta japonica]|uniref:Uncharacterized protein n=1 Tax=Eumeta variegata TaxID=151549 RepID=A0A4C2AC28_EUMVA|nr:hypothetical protein EVAR_94017_1 [Eumeta japonica]